MQGAVDLRLAGISGSMSPLLIALGVGCGGVLVAGLTRALSRALGGGQPRRTALVWGCGGTRLSPRMQYTATAYAEPLTRVFDDVLRPEHDIDITHHQESRYLVESVSYPADGVRPDRGPPVPTPGRRRDPVGRARPTRAERQPPPLPRLRAGRAPRRPGRGGGHLVSGSTVWSAAGAVLQVLVVVVGAPLLVALMRQVRARLEGRAGAGLAQPWRDLRKQLGKEPIAPEGSTIVFAAAPAVVVTSTLLIAAAAPFVATTSPLDGTADLYAVVSLLLVGSIALAFAGLDTGAAFGGMGSSRTVTVAALAEPTLLVAGFALSVRVGSSNLASLVEHTQRAPSTILSPATLLAAVALWIVVVAEAGRLPVDNPATHLELTMIHEATVLEYAGRDLALVELGSAMRLAILLGLWGNLFLPWGVATTSHPAALAVGALVWVLKVAVLGGVLAVSEVFMAKWRLFRIPELLAGSFLFGVLAVSSSFFLA